MSFHCQSAPKRFLRAGNLFNIKNVILTSHFPGKIVLPQCKGYSNCTKVRSVSAALKTQRGQAIPLSFLLPSSVCMSTKPFGEIDRKQIVLASPSHCCNRNKRSSNPFAVNSNYAKDSQEGLLSFNNLISQSIQSSDSIHTWTTPHITYEASHNLDNRHSTERLHNFPPPTPPKSSSFWGLHSKLMSCNISGQLFTNTRRGLHSSPQCRDIYIIESEEEFEKKVMESKLPVVINFHADWCEPCQALKPLLEGLAEKYQGRMHLAEIKVDDHVALLHAFEVTAVPAVLGVVKGQVTEKFVGLISETEVRAFINTMIDE